MEPVRVLLTGGGGFIGSTVRAVMSANGHAPQFNVSQWNQSVNGSLLSRENQINTLESLYPDVVLHLAWHPTDSPFYEHSKEHLVWAKATLQFAEECNRRGIHFVCAGSVVDDSDSIPNPQILQSEYSKSKQTLRRRLLDSPMDQGLVTWMQIHYVFSIQRKRPRVLAELFSTKNKQAFMPQFPNHRHDFIHVADVANAISTILIARLNGLVVVCSGFQVTTLEFIEMAKYRVGFTCALPSIQPSFSEQLPSFLVQNGWLPNNTQNFFNLPGTLYEHDHK